MRLSRPCYDKPHRCPGWAGGGWKFGKVDRCRNGSIRTSTGEYPGVRRWRFGRCTKCDVVTWPYHIRLLDPSNYVMEARLRWQRLLWAWEDRNL